MDWDIQMPMRQPWSSLLMASTARRLATDSFGASDNAEQCLEMAEQVAERNLCEIADFLSGCSDLSFFFIGCDHRNGTIVRRCGPNRRNVRSLLEWRGKTSGGDRRPADVYNQIYNATQILVDELHQRQLVSFVLIWRLPDDPVPQLETSIDLSREEGWTAIRLSLPVAAMKWIAETPPPTKLELERETIEPAPPSILEPDPAACSIFWPEFQRINPMRSPDWRWNRAHALVRFSRYITPRRDDQETGRAARFLRKLAKSPQDPESVKSEFPDLFAAHAIYTGSSLFRVELEARILARQSSEEISGHFSAPSACVEAYLATFFDVRDRLGSGTYIRQHVLRPDGGTSAENLLMSLAYHGGPFLLDSALCCINEDVRKSVQLADWGSSHDLMAERLSLLCQARHLPQDPKTAQDLMQHFWELIDVMPSSSPEIDLVGIFSQISSPFGGILESVKPSPIETASRAA